MTQWCMSGKISSPINKSIIFVLLQQIAVGVCPTENYFLRLTDMDLYKQLHVTKRCLEISKRGNCFGKVFFYM